MTTCDAVRNRLLAEADPKRVPAEVRPHVAGCAACREFLSRYGQVEEAVAALPAPSSELAKVGFVDSVTSAGPIIRSVPSIAVRAFSWRAALHRAAKPLAATAAVVAVGVGLW